MFVQCHGVFDSEVRDVCSMKWAHARTVRLTLQCLCAVIFEMASPFAIDVYRGMRIRREDD